MNIQNQNLPFVTQNISFLRPSYFPSVMRKLYPNQPQQMVLNRTEKCTAWKDAIMGRTDHSHLRAPTLIEQVLDSILFQSKVASYPS